jgi:hypothetical protein
LPRSVVVEKPLPIGVEATSTSSLPSIRFTLKF